MGGIAGRRHLGHESAEHSHRRPRRSKTSYQYTLRGPDITELYRQGERLMAQLQDSPMLIGVNVGSAEPQSDP